VVGVSMWQVWRPQGTNPRTGGKSGASSHDAQNPLDAENVEKVLEKDMEKDLEMTSAAHSTCV
jgi:hypothetical protein